MINLHERMLPTSAGAEPATSWSPVGRRIQLSHRGRPIKLNKISNILNEISSLVNKISYIRLTAGLSKTLLAHSCMYRYYTTASLSSPLVAYLYMYRYHNTTSPMFMLLAHSYITVTLTQLANSTLLEHSYMYRNNIKTTVLSTSFRKSFFARRFKQKK